MASPNKSDEIQLIRIYNAPVKKVWDAWTTNHVGNWWGPRGFTLTTKSKDIKTGGSWIYTMHGPDGKDFPNHTRYLELKKYSRMGYDQRANEQNQRMNRITATFTEQKGKK